MSDLVKVRQNDLLLIFARRDGCAGDHFAAEDRLIAAAEAPAEPTAPEITAALSELIAPIKVQLAFGGVYEAHCALEEPTRSALIAAGQIGATE